MEYDFPVTGSSGDSDTVSKLSQEKCCEASIYSGRIQVEI